MAGLPGLRGQEWPAAGHHVSDGRMLSSLTSQPAAEVFNGIAAPPQYIS